MNLNYYGNSYGGSDWRGASPEPDDPDMDGWVCQECDGEGRIPNYHGTGNEAGGYADTCEACNGTGRRIDDAPQDAPETPIDYSDVPY